MICGGRCLLASALVNSVYCTMNDADIHWLEQLLAKGSSYLSMVGNGFYRFYESFLLEFLAAVSSSVNHHVHLLVCVHV